MILNISALPKYDNFPKIWLNSWNSSSVNLIFENMYNLRYVH
jgi:hypothetical protein